jgi:hypothetical protein
MEIGVRLTVVASQAEADVICGLLRVNGIECGERVTDVSAWQRGSEAAGRETGWEPGSFP